MPGTDLTPERLTKLLATATPGPWHVDGLHTSAVIVRMSEHAWRRVAETFHNLNWRADATLIALSPSLAARVIELEVERLQAIAARAKPPADVAALVEEAREFAGKSMRSADTYRETRRRELAEEREEVADLVNRLAAALTAQAERADHAEEARRIAALEIAGKHLALKLAEFYRLGRVSPSECQAMREWMALMPARAALEPDA